ncbi:PilW family protein [Tichowtungia aerotolerans]|uniref:Prepilin-type N-terminal cleavage/methylation domain-containing protein n=1 Tax=Tichowtungia aerotolerans TaxID=2697043 RepID=A0A6P1MD65_9BACT|nr:prepilin-type N-terminal cleavage/methylation domain-containing protein [Tichowtungia aerotolerans]QHI70514.1 prepilin-type N-terminal cleavage/methylation domain-containing protein [Tichowtungia aerotolerans]
MKAQTKSSQKGFSIIEVMITIIVASVLVLIVSMILVMTFTSWRNNNAYTDIRRDLSMASLIMMQEIRESSYGGLTVGEDYLNVESAATNKTSVFSQVDDSLVYTSEWDTFILIPRNLQSFNAVKQNDGVELTLVVANTDFAISVTNQLFVNTRN